MSMVCGVGSYHLKPEGSRIRFCAMEKEVGGICISPS